MALFAKKNTEEKKEAPAQVAAAPTASGVLAHVLRSPRITEKASMHVSSGVYTFDISETATKRDVVKAVRMLYGVSPRKVRVVPVPEKIKRNMRTGKRGVKHGGKKAYVYLKKGESITLA